MAPLLLLVGLGVKVVNGPKGAELMKADVDGLGRWKGWVGREGKREMWEGYMRGFEGEMQDNIKSPSEIAAKEP
jgi:hypothetical protein